MDFSDHNELNKYAVHINAASPSEFLRYSIYLAALSYVRNPSFAEELEDKIIDRLRRERTDAENDEMRLAEIIHETCLEEMTQRVFGSRFPFQLTLKRS